jgi:hypothetical protein
LRPEHRLFRCIAWISLGSFAFGSSEAVAQSGSLNKSHLASPNLQGLRPHLIPALSLDLPGGYWTIAERGTPEPPTGHDERQVGGWLAAVGLLRTFVGVGQVIAGSRHWCGPSRTFDMSRSDCGAFRVFGWSGVVLGGVLAATGIFYLGLGSVRGHHHRRWMQGRPIR